MTGLILSITVLAFLVPIYVYVGYPMLLFILSKLVKGKPIDKADITPRVSMVVSCFNEREIIEEKIKNCLDIDYPAEMLDFVFVSDGSDDGTDELIRDHSGARISLIRQDGRLGKTMGLNLAVPDARGEIIVFSDANAMYDAKAIRMLVQNFNDENVGYVVGAALYRDKNETTAGSSENAYWQYEIFIKKIESKLHSVVGGDGAIYAIRKSLFETLDQEDINDFVNPLHIVIKGYRGVFETEAICYEETAGSFLKEARRKQRIVNRSFNGLLKNRVVLNPFKHGFFSIEIISHKLLRWLIPFFMVIAGLGVFFLAQYEWFIFQVGLMLGIVGIWLIVLGYFLKDKPVVPYIFLLPYYFYLVNKNSLVGVLRALRGEVQITWSSPRHKVRSETQDTVFLTAMQLMLIMISIVVFTDTLLAIV